MNDTNNWNNTTPAHNTWVHSNMGAPDYNDDDDRSDRDVSFD